MIIWVTGAPRRTVVGHWQFNNVCARHLHSQVSKSDHLILKTASVQVVKIPVAYKTPFHSSIHPCDHFQSRYVTPWYKPFSRYLFLTHCKNIYISIGWEGKLNVLIFLEPIQSFYISMEPSSFLRMTYITNDNYYSSWNHETHQEDDGGHWSIAWIVHHGKCFRHVTIAGCHKHQPGSKSLQWLQSIKFQANIYLTTVK